jgi:hypothetical protein
MEKGRIATDAASYASRNGWGGDPINGNLNGMNTPTHGDDKDVRKLNPYLIDPSGTALHVGYGRMT